MITGSRSALGMLSGILTAGVGEVPLADIGAPPPEIAATIPEGMVPADFWQVQQYGQTYIPQPGGTTTGTLSDWNRRIIGFAEDNTVWVIGGTLAVAALIMLTGGRRR